MGRRAKILVWVDLVWQLLITDILLCDVASVNYFLFLEKIST